MKYCTCLLLLWVLALQGSELRQAFDVVVYGSNGAAIMAAIQCARMGKSVVLLSPGRHLGGMTSNGLGCVDVTDPTLIGGLAHEFFHRVWLYYLDEQHWLWENPRFLESQAHQNSFYLDTMWLIEPHIAELIFNEMLSEHKVTIVLKERLNRETGVYKTGLDITEIVMESGAIFRGKIYIDATYEGDLMAAAGISFCLGREANSLYQETLNGIRPNINMPLAIDCYQVAGDTKSGLIARVFSDLNGESGQADCGVQAYNYRFCLTDIEPNVVRIEKPEKYQDTDYELLFRAIETGHRDTTCFKLTALPNLKIDANHFGPISTDYTGMSWEYAEADYETREHIAYEHELWQRGLLWTLQNHPRIPANIRAFYRPFGLAKDEFADNNNWPYELYVREARRMVADAVISENTAMGRENPPEDSIGLASYHLDCHAVKYYVNENGLLKTDGGIYQKIPKPFPISYSAIVPKRKECHNLLVPVCLSASHVAYGSIRMEPVFMVLGQSAATAACLALDAQCSVQDIPYTLLCKQLLRDGQVLDRINPLRGQGY